MVKGDERPTGVTRRNVRQYEDRRPSPPGRILREAEDVLRPWIRIDRDYRRTLASCGAKRKKGRKWVWTEVFSRGFRRCQNVFWRSLLAVRKDGMGGKAWPSRSMYRGTEGYETSGKRRVKEEEEEEEEKEEERKSDRMKGKQLERRILRDSPASIYNFSSSSSFERSSHFPRFRRVIQRANNGSDFLSIEFHVSFSSSKERKRETERGTEAFAVPPRPLLSSRLPGVKWCV